MKKMKRFIALPIACIAAFSLVACDKDAPHSHSYDESEWAKNETMHWHAATCNCENVYADAAGHTDDDHDGYCDVCGYLLDATHTHTYENDWTSDASGHWHKADCFHDVKGDFAEHTPDKFGDCTECGYHVADPVIDTVAKAIEYGVAQKSAVKVGAMTTDVYVASAESGYVEEHNGEMKKSYQFRADHFFVSYMSDYGVEMTEYYAKDTDGKVWGVAASIYGEDVINGVDERNLNGVQVSAFMDTEELYFGAEELVENLYKQYKQLNENGDWTENYDAETGEYSYGFGVYNTNYGLYKIEVKFTLDEETYSIANVSLSSVCYDSANITTNDEGATYQTIENAKSIARMYVEFEQKTELPTPENPYAPENILVQDFKVTDDYGADVEEVTLKVGEDNYTSYYLTEGLVPETALLGTATIEIAGEGVTAGLSASSGLFVNTSGLEYGYFTLMGYAAGEYEVEITINDVTHVLPVTVEAEKATAAYIGTYRTADFGWGLNYYLDIASGNISKTLAEVAEGFTFAVGLDKGEGVSVSVDPTATLSGPTKIDSTKVYIKDVVADETVANGSNGASLYTCTLTGLAEGTYTITVKATDDETITASMTLIVGDAQQGGGEEGGDDDTTLSGEGTENSPYVLTESGEYTSQPGEEYIYYTYTATTAGTVTLAFTTEDLDCAWDKNNSMWDMMQNAVFESATANITVEEGDVIYIKIGCGSCEADVDVTFTLTTPSTAVAGTTTDNPIVITESGDFVASSVNGSSTYYTYTATVDGTVTIVLNNAYQAAGGCGTSGWGLLTSPFGANDMTQTVEVAVTAGQTLYIDIYAYNEDTADIPFTITLPTVGGGTDTPATTSGTFTIKDNNQGTFTGTYTYTIGDDNVVTVLDEDGTDVSSTIIFGQDMGGFWTVQIVGAMNMPVNLTDANNVSVKELSGTLNVNYVMSGLFVFDFTSESTGGDDEVATSGTFTVTDNNNNSLTGTYTFEIGEYNAVTVYDSTGEVTTDIIFTQDMGGYWGVSTSGMMRTQPLYDADGNMVTELSGTLYVNAMMNGLYVFDFGGEGGSGDDNTGDDTTNDDGLVLGENSVTVTVEQCYCEGTYVTFTATEAGTYTIAAAEGEEHADLMAVNANYEWITLPYEFTLEAGESYSFIVCTTDYMYDANTETIELVITKA